MNLHTSVILSALVVLNFACNSDDKATQVNIIPKPNVVASSGKTQFSLTNDTVIVIRSLNDSKIKFVANELATFLKASLAVEVNVVTIDNYEQTPQSIFLSYDNALRYEQYQLDVKAQVLP